jgi:hypothetical protein
MRAARFLICKMPSPAIRIRSSFFKCLVIRVTRLSRKFAPRPFRQLVLFGQACGELVERNRNFGQPSFPYAHGSHCLEEI